MTARSAQLWKRTSLTILQSEVNYDTPRRARAPLPGGPKLLHDKDLATPVEYGTSVALHRSSRRNRCFLIGSSSISVWLCSDSLKFSRPSCTQRADSRALVGSPTVHGVGSGDRGRAISGAGFLRPASHPPS